MAKSPRTRAASSRSALCVRAKPSRTRRVKVKMKMKHWRRWKNPNPLGQTSAQRPQMVVGAAPCRQQQHIHAINFLFRQLFVLRAAELGRNTQIDCELEADERQSVVLPPVDGSDGGSGSGEKTLALCKDDQRWKWRPREPTEFQCFCLALALPAPLGSRRRRCQFTSRVELN